MFKSALRMEQKESEVFILTDPLVYKNKKYTIEVSQGFDFDGASIPRIFWTIIGSPMSGKHVRAACLHDALYASRLLPRDECDSIFLEAMGSDKVDWIVRKFMYRGVRIGGKGAYDEGDAEPYLKLVRIING